MFSDGSMEWSELTPVQKRQFLFGQLPLVTAMFLGMAIFFSFVAGSVLAGAAVMLSYIVVLSLFFLMSWMDIRRSKTRYQFPKPGKTKGE